MNKGGMRACIWLSLIAFAILSLIATIKVVAEKPIKVESLIGIIGRVMGAFLFAVFIPLGVFKLIFIYLLPQVSRTHRDGSIVF